MWRYLAITPLGLSQFYFLKGSENVKKANWMLYLCYIPMKKEVMIITFGYKIIACTLFLERIETSLVAPRNKKILCHLLTWCKEG